jgi:hypothetical protein
MIPLTLLYGQFLKACMFRIFYYVEFSRVLCRSCITYYSYTDAEDEVLPS